MPEFTQKLEVNVTKSVHFLNKILQNKYLYISKCMILTYHSQRKKKDIGHSQNKYDHL